MVGWKACGANLQVFRPEGLSDDFQVAKTVQLQPESCRLRG